MAVSQPTRTQRLCKIDRCEKPAKGRGWCSMHWWRWKNYGDPHYKKQRGQKPPKPCTVEGCGERAHAHGYCGPHYYRFKKYGSPTVEGPGQHSGRKRLPTPGYDTLHRRLSRDLGSAKTHTCVDCGKQAAEWSYNGGCPNELHDTLNSSSLAYSLDAGRYSPRCVKCHRRKDLSLA